VFLFLADFEVNSLFLAHQVDILSFGLGNLCENCTVLHHQFFFLKKMTQKNTSGLFLSSKVLTQGLYDNFPAFLILAKISQAFPSMENVGHKVFEAFQ
jgi:hypothetical protein